MKSDGDDIHVDVFKDTFSCSALTFIGVLIDSLWIFQKAAMDEGGPGGINWNRAGLNGNVGVIGKGHQG